jgi:hypothetical protein
MQIDVADVVARMAAIAILLLAIFCIAAIWAAALDAPLFHIPWVQAH